jgi:hypothetical protein
MAASGAGWGENLKTTHSKTEERFRVPSGSFWMRSVIRLQAWEFEGRGLVDECA